MQFTKLTELISSTNLVNHTWKQLCYKTNTFCCASFRRTTGPLAEEATDISGISPVKTLNKTDTINIKFK